MTDLDTPLDDLIHLISPTRFATYLSLSQGDRARAMRLYQWNTEASLKFFELIQYAELALRNAATEVLDIEFGANWHKNVGFHHSLPQKTGGGYCPRSDIAFMACKHKSAGNVVAELKLVFWQHLFAKMQYKRLWEQHLGRVFPDFDRTKNHAQARAVLHADINSMRELRNRIAHHEPIFLRDLDADFACIHRIIAWRRTTVAHWLKNTQGISSLLDARKILMQPKMPGKNAGIHTAYTPEKMVPGLADLRKMAAILLAEHAPADARILVLGAGGGQEMVTFAQMYSGWHQTGVDPSTDMLDLARDNMADFADRMELVTGYIDDAPMGPFDGAACLLTLHFLQPEQRLATLIAMRARMRSGAKLVIAHHSYDDPALWLGRFAQFAASNGVTGIGVDAMASKLPAMAPAEDERLLYAAGFENVQLFYAALSFRGWVASNP